MIHYSFFVDEGSTADFAVDENGDTSVEVPGEPVPEWVRLERSQCTDCPLAPGSRKTCPAALSIKPVVEAFGNSVSFENIQVKAQVNGVKLEATVPAQHAVRPLVGLLLALSSCPVMTKLRPMAHFHLPFGGQEHTAFRHLGTYLIAQYLRQRHGLAPAWDLTELRGLFMRLHMVNRALAERLREASVQDATVNSLITLDTFAKSAEMDIEEHFSQWEEIFEPYLKDPVRG